MTAVECSVNEICEKTKLSRETFVMGICDAAGKDYQDFLSEEL
jgi:hypothetical protein